MFHLEPTPISLKVNEYYQYQKSTFSKPGTLAAKFWGLVQCLTLFYSFKKVGVGPSFNVFNLNHIFYWNDSLTKI